MRTSCSARQCRQIAEILGICLLDVREIRRCKLLRDTEPGRAFERVLENVILGGLERLHDGLGDARIVADVLDRFLADGGIKARYPLGEDLDRLIAVLSRVL